MGVFDDERLKATWRFSTDSRRTEDEHELLIAGLLHSRDVDPTALSAIVMCSVVPPVTRLVEQSLTQLTGHTPLMVGPGIKTGIQIRYDRTQDVGSDRIADAVAAHAMCSGSVIVVDFGTATKFEAITEAGEYMGGAIAPGLLVAAEALYQRTAQLRRVEVIPPETAIGRNTVASLQSGIVYGYVGLVEGLVRRIKKELCPDDPGKCRVIATGGLAPLIHSHTDVFDELNQELTLEGLRLIHERNSDWSNRPAP